MKKNPFYSGAQQLKRCSGSPGVKREEQGRDPFSKDYARLLHAPAFRRLQGKTQLFPGAESDFFRNRLTHSLEVAQIARGIAARLNATDAKTHFGRSAEISEELVEFAAIAHDLGHPPFGHNGEHALDELMREHGGFEGNAQTLRILAAVERKLVRPRKNGPSSSSYGLDLTFRSLAAVLKYDHEIAQVREHHSSLQKGYYTTEATLVRKMKSRVAPGLPEGERFKTIECAIMDIADDIAYSTYDLEDSLHAGFVTPMRLISALHDAEVGKEVLRKTNRGLTEAGYEPAINVFELVSTVLDVFHTVLPPTVTTLLQSKKSEQHVGPETAVLVNREAWLHDRRYCDDALARSSLTAERVGLLIAAVELVPNAEFPQLSSVRMKRPELLHVEVLKHLNYELVIRSPQLAVVEHRGKELVAKIFRTLSESDGSLLPSDWQHRHMEAKKKGVSAAKRLICDYVACMTDSYAAELHGRLFGEGSSIFKPL